MAANETNIQRYMVAGNIYLGVTKPANGAAMGHTNGVPTGGTDVGATIGEATFEYRPTIAMVDIEQAYSGVAPHLTNETATLRATLAEATYANILSLMQQGTGSTGGGLNKITVGGKTAVTQQCVAVISKQADQNKYNWVCMYKCISMDGVSLPFKRGEVRRIGMNMTAIPDTARDAGDQLAQIVEEQ